MAPVSTSKLPIGPQPVPEREIGKLSVISPENDPLELLRFVLETANIGTWEWDIRTDHVFWSDSMALLSGIDPRTFPQTLEGFLEGVYPFDRDRVLQTVQKTLDTGGEYEIEYRQLTSSGNIKWMQGRGRLISDSAGRPARMIGICMDITERKRAEEELHRAYQELQLRTMDRAAEVETVNQELRTEIEDHGRTIEALQRSEERFRLLLESIRDHAIYMLDVEGRVLTWNSGAEQMTGYSRQEIMGKHFSVFYTPEDIRGAKPEAALRMAAEHGRYEQEGWRLRKDGSRFWANVVLTPLHDAHGHLTGFSKVTQDLTERKVSEESLRELSGLVLRLQDEERGRLARELHDSTAQTLSALSLNLALFNKISSVAKQPQAAKVLSDSLTLADQASRELRTLSYLLHPPLLDDSGVAQALRWYIDGFIQRTQIEVDLTISPPELGRLPNELERTILRIVQECLTNVYRHSQSSTASVHLVRGPAEVTLVVQDQGKGFPSEESDQAAKPSVTLGVGIRGMMERVKQLGGSMQVRAANPGTIVEVALPAPRRRRRARPQEPVG
ncbi:MAG: PAS domain S-box protein [Acidobacteria bacterium]|nr:PAS domain S-box protein [Acidobacteriota bacterium]